MSQKIAVVYFSKNGSTQRYAEWIARSCKADLFPYAGADIDRLAEYDTVIYGSCVYSGVIQGIRFIKDNRDLLANTRLAVFAVGLTQPGDDTAFEEVLNRNFTPEERTGLTFFHFPGALDYKKLSFFQRGMMRMLKKSIQKRPAESRSQMEQYILDSYGGRVDFTSFTYVKPLVDWACKG